MVHRPLSTICPQPYLFCFLTQFLTNSQPYTFLPLKTSDLISFHFKNKIPISLSFTKTTSLSPQSNPTYTLHRCVPTKTLFHPSNSLFFVSSRRHDWFRSLRYSGPDRTGRRSAVRTVLQLGGILNRAVDGSARNSDDLKPQVGVLFGQSVFDGVDLDGGLISFWSRSEITKKGLEDAKFWYLLIFSTYFVEGTKH